MKMIKNILKLIGLLIMVMIGCDTIQKYDISIKNIGEQTLEDAHVFFKDFRSIGGVLPPGVRKLHLQPNCPIPENVTVQWRTEDNVLHKKNINIKEILPKNFQGEIRFEIDNGNNVSVNFVER